MENYFTNGKLLITGEYLVLRGAKAFALPTKLGQSLSVSYQNSEESKKESSTLKWAAFLEDKSNWFTAEVDYKNWTLLNATDVEKGQMLLKILKQVSLQTDFFKNKEGGIQVTTQLDFKKDWGLGSSSTLIHNIALWLKINPYKLLENTFGGSGYDIAVGKEKAPIFYEITQGNPKAEKVEYKPCFTDNIHFVYLNQKQISRDEIKKFKQKKVEDSVLEQVSEISEKVSKAHHIDEFSSLLQEHEQILSEILETPTIKEQLFSDYPFVVKSLGAWGGDFVMVLTQNDTDLEYFKNKGFDVILSYDQMIL